MLLKYDYEIIFIDNKSTDKTRKRIQEICKGNKKVKAIFNANNFGPFRSPYYGILQAKGGCVMMFSADFQDPVELIPEFIKQWEKGFKIVVGIKSSSKENKLMYLIRTLYYKLIKKYSEVEMIEHFTGFGLYDKKFIDVLKTVEDPMPFLRGMVAELGFERKEIHYEQAKRRAGRTKTNWYSLYDAGMLGLTSYTKVGLRFATLIGFVTGAVSILVGLVYFVYKIIYWKHFPLGLAPVTIGIFFLGAVQIFFIGIVGEYVLNINSRVMRHPLVVEEKRINFGKSKDENKTRKK